MMYDNYKMQASQATSSLELMKAMRAARSNMAMATRTTDAITATMEEQIRKALADAGVTGREASNQLAMFMHKLQFQIANGEHDGFEQLMDDIYKQFNTAVDFGELAGDKVDTAALKLATQQNSVGGALDMLKGMLGSDQEKYAKYKAAILAKLGKEYQLAQVTDEELREHLAKLRSTLAVLSVRNHPLPRRDSDAPAPAIPGLPPALPGLPAAPAVGAPTAGGTIPGALAEVETGE